MASASVFLAGVYSVRKRIGDRGGPALKICSCGSGENGSESSPRPSDELRPAEPKIRSRVGPAFWRAGGIGLAYLGLTLLLTRPGVSPFSTHFMADGGDGFQNVWNLWWVKTALLQGQWPWWTDRLFVPDGVSLYFHTLGFTNGLPSLPYQLLFPHTSPGTLSPVGGIYAAPPSAPRVRVFPLHGGSSS